MSLGVLSPPLARFRELRTRIAISALGTHLILTLPPSLPHALFHPLPCSSMSPLRLLKPSYLNLCHPRSPLRFSSLAAAAVCRDTSVWTQAPISGVSSAAESLYHFTVDVSDAPFLASSYSRSGQYLQVRIPEVARPTFLAIASPPSVATKNGVFEFLVKSVRGSTAEVLCGLNKGDVVELSQVIGRGFEIDQIEPSRDYSTVLIFATGSGISPIRSLIESGFSANKRSDVTLYYGARNLKRMAYQDRFKDWESSGIEIVPVLSQPDSNWRGEIGYVQDAFVRAKKIFDPHSAGAVLCGRRQMTEEIRSLLVADGVSSQRILMNA